MQSENPHLRQKLEPFRCRWPMIAYIALAISAVTYYQPARLCCSRSTASAGSS